MSLFSRFSTMSATLYMLVLGLCLLAEVDKCIASLGETTRDASTNSTTIAEARPSSSHQHDERMLESETDRNLISPVDSFFDNEESMPVVIVRIPEEQKLTPMRGKVSRESSEGLSDLLGTDMEDTIPVLMSKKLGMCEGDCDSDDDCEDGLYCFFKDGGRTTVPGCSGSDTSPTDYCTKKEEDPPAISTPNSHPHHPMLFVFPENPPNPANLPLKRCQGDCDSDDDCEEGLICYQRLKPNQITIPGCSGISTTRTDFCVDPSPWRDPTPEEQATNAPTRDPTLSLTSAPSAAPLEKVTSAPTAAPSEPQDDDALIIIARIPVKRRTAKPTRAPTSMPTNPPTFAPTFPKQQMVPPTGRLTRAPTLPPTNARMTPPTRAPLQQQAATRRPTLPPTRTPTFFPTKPKTNPPTNIPTALPTNAPTKLPTLSPTNSPTARAFVNVTFAIYFDPWPQELSWKIETASSVQELLFSVPTGTYQRPQDHVFEVVQLAPGMDYILTIEDSSNDGIAGIGTLYEMYLTEHPEIKLVDGDGGFQSARKQIFHVPILDMFPTSAPVALEFSRFPNVPTVKVYLIILFDNWHQETAWTIADETDPSKIYAEANYDDYRSGESITEEIILPAGGIYIFTIRDFFSDGIQDGGYLLMDEQGGVIFQGDGNFGSFRSHAFQLPGVPPNEISPVFASMRDDEGDSEPSA